MPYSRLLNLDEETKLALVSYIDDEYRNHLAERQELISRLEQDQKDYWAEPTQEVKTFPFYGASNIIIPLTAIAVEAVHSRMFTSLFELEQFTSVKIHMKGLPATADRVLEKYFDYELFDTIKIRRPVTDITLELTKFGTGIGKVGYEYETKKAVRFVGETEQEFIVVTKAGPCWDATPVSRFLMPFYAQDIQTAPWCGEEHDNTLYNLKTMQADGMFYDDTYEALLTYYSPLATDGETGSGLSFTRNQETLEKKDPVQSSRVLPNRVPWIELWMAYDVDGDDVEEEIQVFFHSESRTLMAVRYNEHEDLRRPYRKATYVPVEHRWDGIGICKQSRQFQKQITTISRQRLDNATLANMRMFKVNKLSGYGPKEPIFPGKMWFLDDMDHIDSIQMGEIYNSAYSNEQASVLYWQQRVGVNELVLGLPQVGTPGTATGDLARIQEGSKKFEYIFDGVKELFSDMIMDTVVCIRQFGSQGSVFLDTIDGGDIAKQILTAPVDAIRRNLIFRASTFTKKANKLVDRQSWQQMIQALQQYYVGMVQLAQGAQNPQVIQAILTKGMVGATEAMRQYLETFDTTNIDRIIINDIEQLLGLGQNGGQALLGPGAVPSAGGNNGPEGNGAASGIQLISQILGAAGGGGGNATTLQSQL